jgi:hypothetical protein
MLRLHNPWGYYKLVDQGPFVQIANSIAVSGTDSPSVDGFGRWRVSEPETVLAASQEYTYHPLVFSHYVDGGASATYTQQRGSTILSTGGTTSTRVAIRQSKNRVRYQEGKSTLVKITSVPVSAGSHAGGSFTECGYGDDRNGIFFRTNNDGAHVIRRSDTSGSVVDEMVHSSRWTIDHLDGDVPSRIDFDITKSQIFVIDLQWLGVGRVRVGFQIGGNLYYVHEFVWANIGSGVYMKTANLPVRWKVSNDGVTGSNVSMECVCAAVESEGGSDDAGAYSFIAGTAGVTVSCPNTVALTPILSVRLKDTFAGIPYYGQVKLSGLDALVSGNPAYFELLWNATLTGGTWLNSVDTTYSGVEYDLGATAVSGGVSIDAGYLSTGSGNQKGLTSRQARNKFVIGKTYHPTAEVSDVLTLACRGIGGAAVVNAVLQISELY